MRRVRSVFGRHLGALLVAGAISGCASNRPVDSGALRVETFEDHMRAGAHVVMLGPEDCPVCAIYEKHRQSVVRIRSGGSVGTGVVLSARGDVLTNAHVVGDAPTVAIETAQGTVVAANVVRDDDDVDLALLRVTSTDVLWTPIDWRDAGPERVGSTIYVIGHPLGLGWTVTQGILSSRRRAGEVASIDLLQTDAAISPGNSGGPVFDSRARPIAIVRSKIVTTGAENIGFVIPWSAVREFIEREPFETSGQGLSGDSSTSSTTPSAR